jgi:hypothetical protein
VEQNVWLGRMLCCCAVFLGISTSIVPLTAHASPVRGTKKDFEIADKPQLITLSLYLFYVIHFACHRAAVSARCCVFFNVDKEEFAS